MTNIKLKLLAGGALFIGALQPAHAQLADAEENDGGRGASDDVIIVTATKQEGATLQDVALSIDTVSGAELQDQAIFTFEDTATLVPGLDLTNDSGRDQRASIRGVAADLDAGTTATVDIYFNESVVDSQTAFSSVYDIGQIEVVRGPQGTLRGRPSPSGAILIQTARPSFSGTSGYVAATVSDNGVQNYQGAIGGPVHETLAVRLAAVYDEGDENAVVGVNNGLEAGREGWSVRGSVAWQPIDGLDVDLVYQKSDSDRVSLFSVFGSGGAGDLSPFDRVTLREGPNSFSNEFDLVTLSVGYELGENHRLDYIGGYQDRQFNTLRDTDITNVISNFQIEQDIQVGSERITNELRFASVDNDFWNYMVGFYYEEGETNTFVSVPLANLTLNNFSTTETLGYFTNHIFSINDNNVFEAGVRYSKDEQVTPSGEIEEYSAVTGNASFKHFFTPDAMAYVSYGRGYRPGGVAGQTQGFVPESEFVYEEETSDSFELGLKTTMLDGRLVANAALFHQTYTNFIGRVDGIRCTGTPSGSGLAIPTNDGTLGGVSCETNVTFNGDGISKGVGLDLAAKLTDRWNASLVYSYVEATFDGALIPCNDYDGDGVPNIDGDPRIQQGRFFSRCPSDGPLGALPKTSFALTSDYVQPVGRFEAFARGLASYKGPVTEVDTGFESEAYTLVNVFLGFRDPDAGWELSVFGKNILEEEVLLTARPGDAFGIVSPYQFGRITPPQEFGVRFQQRFGG